MADEKRKPVKGPTKFDPKLDYELLLSADEKAAIELDVEREENEKLKEMARVQYKAAFALKKARELGLAEPQVTITVDVADYANDIRIDGVVYQQGMTYTYPASTAVLVMHMMQQTFKHEREINGKSEHDRRRPRNMVLNAHDVATPAADLNAR